MAILPVQPPAGSVGQMASPPSSCSLSGHLVTAIGLGLGVGVGLAVAPQFATQRGLLAKTLLGYFTQRRTPSYLWGGALGSLGCISLATDIAHMEENVVEPRTGVSFPGVLNDNKQLAGIGLRKKNILGLKSINVYAFGLYADEGSMKEKLHHKYWKLPVTELKASNAFYEDVMKNDVGLTVRLVIVYGNLNIGSVRSAFEESIGNRLKKFSGTQNKELLLRFTSQFKDEFKLPRGTTIDLTRLPGHVLQTKSKFCIITVYKDSEKECVPRNYKLLVCILYLEQTRQMDFLQCCVWLMRKRSAASRASSYVALYLTCTLVKSHLTSRQKKRLEWAWHLS